MSATFECDYREWQRAITEYSAACNVELAYAMNRQTVNFMVKTRMKLLEAAKESIEALRSNNNFMKWLIFHCQKPGVNWFQAREQAYKVLNMRVAAVTFLRAFVGQVIRQLKSAGSIRSGAAGKNFSGFQTTVKEATPSSLSVEIHNVYTYKRKHASSQAAFAEKQLQQAMDASMQETIEDMTSYTQRRLASLARRYSRGS